MLMQVEYRHECGVLEVDIFPSNGNILKKGWQIGKMIFQFFLIFLKKIIMPLEVPMISPLGIMRMT